MTTRLVGINMLIVMLLIPPGNSMASFFSLASEFDKSTAFNPLSSKSNSKNRITNPDLPHSSEAFSGSTNLFAPEYEISTTGGALIITDQAGNGDTLYVSESGSDIVFDVPGRGYSLDGGPSTFFPVTISLSGMDIIQINTETGDDVINLNIPNLDLPDLVINGGVGDDDVWINSDLNLLPDYKLDIDLQDDDASPGIDQIVLNTNCKVLLRGDGGSILRASRNISFLSGSLFTTEKGNLTIEANQQATPTSGDFTGITMDNSFVGILESGHLIITGRGGDSGHNQIGVLVSDSTHLFGGDNGSNLVTGTGGMSTGNTNVGVLVSNGSILTTNGGDLKVTGSGGGSGSSSNNSGVLVEQAGTITSGGSGIVIINGTGGATAGYENYGVTVDGMNSSISTTTGGNIFVTGEGGGSGTSSMNIGVYIHSSAYISSVGSGDVTLAGTGGVGSGGDNYGIGVENSCSLSTTNGNIDIVGTGGGSGNASRNYGMYLEGEVEVSGSGDIHIDVTGGSSEGHYNYGLYGYSSLSLISSSTGNMTIEGNGGGTSLSVENIGVYLTNGAEINAGSSGTATIQGTGGITEGFYNHGVVVEVFGSTITSNGAGLTIIGQGGGMGSSDTNIGVSLRTNCVVSTGGGGNLLVQGTGGAANGGQNIGVGIADNAMLTTSGGNIHVIGEGGGTGTGSNNHGVLVEFGGEITGVGTGAVTVDGTGGTSSGGENHGVFVDGWNALISGADGDLIVTGEGGGSGSSYSNIGVSLDFSGNISTVGAGNISINGTGGMSTGSNNHGISVTNTCSVSTTNGNIDVVGTGGGSGSSQTNCGMRLEGVIEVTGSGDIHIEVTGGSSEGHYNYGLYGYGSVSLISSNTGNMTIEGNGGGASLYGDNSGIYLTNGAEINAGSSGTVMIQGTGGITEGFYNHGVVVEVFGSTITSSGADLTIIGQGGGMGSSDTNIGVVLRNNCVVSPGGGGDILVQGTGGAANGGLNIGVDIADNATLTTSGGNIHVTGQGGGTGTGSFNYGVIVEYGGEITGVGTGAVTVEGTGGTSSGGENHGVNIYGWNALISGADGDVIVTGEGGGSGSSYSNIGVSLDFSGNISTVGTGNISINGTGGMSTGSNNHGISVTNTCSVSTTNGNIDVVGTGGGSGSSQTNFGMRLEGVIEVTGSGDIHIDVTGGSSEGHYNYGLYGYGSVSLISNSTGNMTIEGNGGGASLSVENTGIYLTNGAEINAGSSGTAMIQGTGGITEGFYNHGVVVEVFGSTITSSGADLTIIGQGGGMGSSDTNIGVVLRNNCVVSPGGGGDIMVQGTGGVANGGQNIGVDIADNATLTTSGGNIHVIGEGGGTGTGSNNHGVLVEYGGEITGVGTGTVTVEGTGGTSSGVENHGVFINGWNALISGANGDVIVTGEGGGSGSSYSNIGVSLDFSGTISTVGAGNISIDGTGGMSTGDENHGISVANTCSISTSDGNIDIVGAGGGSDSSSSNYGMRHSGQIDASGNGDIHIEVMAGPAEGNQNYGLYCFSSIIESNFGNLTIEGYGGGSSSSSDNAGIYMTNGSEINGGMSGTLIVQGEGGASTGSDNHGVYLTDNGTTITTQGVDIFINGLETGSAPGFGIFHTADALISTASSFGNVHLSANSMNIDAVVSTSSIDTVFVNPYSPGTEIILGPADDPVGGPLQLSDAELDSIQTYKLVIGSAVSGTISIDSNITRPLQTDMALISGGDVTFLNGYIDNNNASMHLDPGPSPFGVLPLVSGQDAIASIVTFGSDLVINLEGIIPDVEYDQMNIEGLIDLTGVDLIWNGSYMPMVGDSFIVIQNDDSDNIIGTFVGLAEGDTIYNFLTAGTDAVITYQGNTGNDAVIRVVAACLLPEVPLVSTSQDTACAGEMITLTIDAGDLGDAVDWYWYSDGCGTTPEGTGSSIIVSPAESTTYYVRGEGGCVSTGPCADITITINAIPDPTINQDAPDPCYYTSNFFQPVAPEIPGATYTWDFGIGAVPANASGYGPHDVMYLAPGPKTVKLVIYPNESGAQCPDSSTIDFTIVNCPGQILGKVFDDFLDPIASVHVLLYADADTNGVADDDTPVRSIFTDSNGNIGMANLTPGHYVLVQNQPSGWTTLDDYDATDDGDVVPNADSLDNLIPVSILPLEIDSMNIFIEKAVPGQITGSVFNDLNLNEIPDPGEGIADVLLEIFPDFNQDGSADTIVPAYTGMTDAMGMYQFMDIPVGHYVIVETQPPGMISVKDFDASNDGDVVPNTNMQDDTIPFTLINMEIDAHNYFIDAPDCSLQVTNTNDDGIGSLRYALGCATDGDTITFHPGMAGSAIEITTSVVLIEKDVVLYSTLMPEVEIHSQITGLFEIDPMAQAEFSDIHIVSGLSPGSTGAAFENYGILILNNVRVTRNPLFMSGEYLIRNHPGSELTIDGTCQFQEN